MSTQHPLKERIKRNGIRQDFLYIWLDINQSTLSYYLNKQRKMPLWIEEKLTEYLDEIEKVNKKFDMIC